MSLRGDTGIRVWVRLRTFPTTCILINRHLQEGDCALAVCQGRTIYPADDVEEKKEEGWAAVRHAVGTCTAYCMSALWQVHDGQQRHSCTERERVCLGLYYIKPFVFVLLPYKTTLQVRQLPLWSGKQSSNKGNPIASNSPQTDLWCRNMWI